MLQIALASQSPRRRELLEQAGYDFRVFPIKVSEIIDENLNPADQAAKLSKDKVEAAVHDHKQLKNHGFLILGVDTIVVLGQRVLGKPANFSEAQQYLRLLSGKTHSVISGFTLCESGSAKAWTGAEKTDVKFRPLGAEEIADYIATGEPKDKAGAYGIQGLGGKFVSSYTGSWSNVVGLPLERLESVLKQNAWIVHRQAPAKP